MLVVQTRIHVASDGSVEVVLPASLPPGDYEAVIVVEQPSLMIGPPGIAIPHGIGPSSNPDVGGDEGRTESH